MTFSITTLSRMVLRIIIENMANSHSLTEKFKIQEIFKLEIMLEYFGKMSQSELVP
jgi:hypothetical protein